ncbi:MAG: dihydrolipoamide dehydrogenase [Alphaproteobacteria bacterium]|nr:dihydrolipoamide dehydrogenase [Alphaproteobacteria bacterium]
MRAIDADICVIGAGSGGLSLAAGAALLGAKTVLFEAHRMGGDCLNTGCVPSKALLASAKRAALMRGAGPFGIRPVEPEIDFAKVQDHVGATIAAIAPTDSVERFEAMGVAVIRARARFAGPREIEGGDVRVRFKFAAIATGSSPVDPPIPGLAALPRFTNETIFANRELPPHLLVIGAGPIGLEMAQAHRRLGAQVTVIEALAALGKDDREAAGIVLSALRREGIRVLEGTKVISASGQAGAIALSVATPQGPEIVTGTHLLIAAGRRPNLGGLALEAAGIATGPGGLVVDGRLRTTNRRVFALGDVAGGPQFTHAAGYQAGIVLRNALFRMPARVDYRAMPWATYTEPELAQVGETEDQVRARGGAVRVLRWPFHENDRAQAEGAAEGLCKIVTDPRGTVLGASIAAPHAGELIAPWVIAVAEKYRIGRMAGYVVPYPTLSEAGKRAAGAFFMRSLFSERTRKLVRLLLRFA